MKKVYVNIDMDTCVCPFLNNVVQQKYFSEEMLYPFVDIYRPTEVTDVVFNIFCQISASPTELMENIVTLTDYMDKHNFKDEFIDFRTGYYKLYTDYKTDPFEIWIKRCKSIGLRPWISFRMNDAHKFSVLTDYSFESFYKSAEQKGWTLGEEYGGYFRCYNYRIKEIRDRMLAYIREQLNRYDVYGIELDFQREIQCFRYLTDDMNECTEIMNEFMREVKGIVSECEKRYGHSIKIGVRMIRDYAHARFYGYDPVVWERENIVDMISPAPRWTRGDSGIPVKEWKELLPSTEVTGGIETAVCFSEECGMVYATEEISRGLAASYLAAGSEGIYFFNYFVNPLYTKSGEDIHTQDAHPYIRNISVLSTCHDYIYDRAVRFAILSQSDEGYAAHPSAWEPLPVNLSDKVGFEIITGKIPDGKKAFVIFGVENYSESIRLSVNEVECVGISAVDLSFIPGIGMQTAEYVSKETNCFRCDIPYEVLDDFCQYLTVESDTGVGVLTWLELVVI